MLSAVCVLWHVVKFNQAAVQIIQKHVGEYFNDVWRLMDRLSSPAVFTGHIGDIL